MKKYIIYLFFINLYLIFSFFVIYGRSNYQNFNIDKNYKCENFLNCYNESNISSEKSDKYGEFQYKLQCVNFYFSGIQNKKDNFNNFDLITNKTISLDLLYKELSQSRSELYDVVGADFYINLVRNNTCSVNTKKIYLFYQKGLIYDGIKFTSKNNSEKCDLSYLNGLGLLLNNQYKDSYSVFSKLNNSFIKEKNTFCTDEIMAFLNNYLNKKIIGNSSNKQFDMNLCKKDKKTYFPFNNDTLFISILNDYIKN